MKPTHKTSPIIEWIDHRLPIFSFMRHELHEYPTPKNLNYLWNLLMGVNVLYYFFKTQFFLVARYSSLNSLKDLPELSLILSLHYSSFFLIEEP